MRFLLTAVFCWLGLMLLELLGFAWLAVSDQDATVQFWIFYWTVGVGVPLVLFQEILFRLRERKAKVRRLEAARERRSLSIRLRKG